MAGRRFIYGLVLIGSVAFYLAYQEWFSWIVLLSVLLFPWLSLILSLPLMFRMKAEPEAMVRIPLGTKEKIQIRVFPEGIQLPLTSKIQITKPLTGVSRVQNVETPLPTEHCGGILAKLHKPYVYDFLGLFRFRLRKCFDATFYVMPRPVGQELPPDLTRYIAQSWHPKPGGGYAENHEIRQYRPGDQLNQIHWKLTAKVGDLMLREPMEPERGRLLLTLDLRGTPGELDDKLGQLLWLGGWLTDHQMEFEICALTGDGVFSRPVRESKDLNAVMDDLLLASPSREGSVLNLEFGFGRQYHIGGESRES